MAGIEPATSAWKAEVLPLNYIRKTHLIYAVTNYSSNCAIVKKILRIGQESCYSLPNL